MFSYIVHKIDGWVHTVRQLGSSLVERKKGHSDDTAAIDSYTMLVMCQVLLKDFIST